MTTDEQEIRNVVTQWMEASKAGDIGAVLSLMTDDVVFLQPGQPPMMGKAAFAEKAKPQQGPLGERLQIDGKSEIQEVQVSGEWAFMWTKLSVTATPPGGAPPIKRAGHTLTVLRKENGRWLLARDANLLVKVD
ncbi:MAG: SgcJ/EcaC family oxidoreductase [Planctomycetia bacterium]|nr:SgcJ/EcaC family oxidoreductase [Planctomycetia bacterium]